MHFNVEAVLHLASSVQGFANTVLNLSYPGFSIAPRTSRFGSSIKVHLAAILVFHPYLDTRSVFFLHYVSQIFERARMVVPSLILELSFVKAKKASV